MANICLVKRWYSSNGPAARLLRWSVLVLCLVTYGPMVKLVTSFTCMHVHISKYQHNTILVVFPTEVTIPGNSLCLESYFSWVFLKKSLFPGSHISQKVTYARKSHFSGSHFPKKSHLPGSHISREVIFPIKSHFPGCQISQEVISQ